MQVEETILHPVIFYSAPTLDTSVVIYHILQVFIPYAYTLN